MSEKKPVIVVPARLRDVCPVCGKVSYSRSGEHPQCAVTRADAITRAERKAAGIEPRKALRRPWFKLCPKCKVQVSASRVVCNCGHHFELGTTNTTTAIAATVPGDKETRVANSSSLRSATMINTPVQDKTITRQVQGKIAGRGLGPPCRIVVDTIKGEVTLTGTVQYAQQKQTAVQATSGISGLRRVIDRLIVKPVAKY